MIEVKTFNKFDGILISVFGHAETVESDKERIQVCAAVGALMLTLSSVTEGNWGGDGSGFVSAHVPATHLVAADFVMAGLQLIEQSYPRQLRIVRKDTKLFGRPETETWNRVSLPTPPQQQKVAD